MDPSYTEGDVTLSPQILDRLQMLRQWQLLQRGKLQKQQLQYNEGSDITSSITELVSHFSNSTSYNTFRSLLQSSQDNTNDISQQFCMRTKSKNSNLQNVVDGISELNLSQESAPITNSPITSKSISSAIDVNQESKTNNMTQAHTLSNNYKSLDDMPILSPKKDFETLVKEKLKDDPSTILNIHNVNNKKAENIKKPFLRRGQGTARFGLRRNDFTIQNTKSLPWKKKGSVQKFNIKSKNIDIKENIKDTKVQVQLVVDKAVSPLKVSKTPLLKKSNVKTNFLNTSGNIEQNLTIKKQIEYFPNNPNTCSSNKYLLHVNKEKTWAAVFTKEQDEFLRKLKQSAYYKNFASPTKSMVSDISCDEQISRLRQTRDETEQNMFELIENKVCHDSFAMDNSFFTRFIKKGDSECSGESTPLVLQKCLSKNPKLLHILPDIMKEQRTKTCTADETCDSDYTECCENYSSSSSCCSCKTVTKSNINTTNREDKNKERGAHDKIQNDKRKDFQCHNDSLTDTNAALNANLTEMNSKLIATSEILKLRLQELEDEIETFRKENANLNKMREEVDMERQKFYEEKNVFEQKFNEEKILSEYYLAEEKEKLGKKKQMYERYIRDMRGHLNKKEKDEIVNLKKEILDLKEETKIKDAKSTSTIARLRSQMKIMEKEKKNLENEVEKIKEENRRMQHSNDITRRLTNLKYLDQINKKLSNMVSRDSKLNVQVDTDVKYRSYEIERQSRNRNSQPVTKSRVKQRAKSVPNLNVTSRYAKYFSQKDSFIEQEKNITRQGHLQTFTCSLGDEVFLGDKDISNSNKINSDSEEENNLEKIYNERFKTPSPNSKRSSTSTSISGNSPENSNSNMENSNYFLHKIPSHSEINSSIKGMSSNKSISHNNTSHNKLESTTFSRKMPRDYKMLNHQGLASDCHINSNQQNTSSASILSNGSSSSQRSGTVINKELLSDTRMIPSPEPSSSKTSLSRTNLTPTEIRKQDGSKELRFPNGNIKLISADGKYSKFIYYNGDVKENFYNEGRIKYYYAETKTFHTTQPDGLEILEFPDGQVEKRYKDGSSEIRLPNGSIRYYDPKNDHVREEWRFPDGAALTVSANGEQRIVFPNGQIEVHTKDHKRREYPDGTMKLIYNDGTSETRYASGRVRIKDKHGNLIMDSAS